jgi:hypothetical protein
MATLDQLGRRLSFDEEGAIIGDESDVDPMSFAGMGIVKPSLRTPVGDFSEMARRSLPSASTPDRPFDSKPLDPEVVALMREETMRAGHSQKPPVVPDIVGLSAEATKTRGPLSLGGQAFRPAMFKEGAVGRGEQEQKITGVPTRTADTATGQTVEGAAPVVKAEMKADAKAQAAGAGGDEGTDNLALGELLARGIGSVYQGATGRELGGNIPEMLSALRQRREAQKLKEQEITREELMRSGALESLGEMFEGQVPGAKDYAKRFRGSAADFIRALGQFTGTEQKQKGLDVRAQSLGLAPVSDEVRAQNKTLADSLREQNPALATIIENYPGSAKEAFAAYPKAESGRKAGEQADVVKPVAAANIRLKGAQTKAAEAAARTAGLKLKQSAAQGAKEIRAVPKGNNKEAEKAITKAMDRANSKTGGNLPNVAAAFQELHSTFPEFAKGQAPEWLSQTDLATAEASAQLAPEARELRRLVEAVVLPIRNSAFGASLTGTEKASFDLLAGTDWLRSSPQELASAINTLRRASARVAQNHFAVALELHPETTARVLRRSNIWNSATAPEGVYGDLFALPAAPAATPVAPAAQRPPKPAAPEGKVVMWDVAQGKWRAYPPDGAAKGKALGKLED